MFRSNLEILGANEARDLNGFAPGLIRSNGRTFIRSSPNFLSKRRKMKGEAQLKEKKEVKTDDR